MVAHGPYAHFSSAQGHFRWRRSALYVSGSTSKILSAWGTLHRSHTIFTFPSGRWAMSAMHSRKRSDRGLDGESYASLAALVSDLLAVYMPQHLC